MTLPEQDVVEHKVRRATAFHALKKISALVEDDLRLDASKERYTRWFLRYGIVLLLVACALSARYLGII